MKKRRNKKLKKEFKKLLQEKLAYQLKESKIEIPQDKETIETTEEKKEVSSERTINETQFVKKDLMKTIFITAFIVGLMIIFYIYLDITHQASVISRTLLKIIGAS